MDACGANETEGGVEVLRLPNRVGAGNSFGMLGDRLIVLRFVVRRYRLFGDEGQNKSNKNPFSWLHNLALSPTELAMNISRSHLDQEPLSSRMTSRP